MFSSFSVNPISCNGRETLGTESGLLEYGHQFRHC